MSNLTVSYVSQTPAAPSAGAPGPAPAPDGPLGFLGALLDHFLTGGNAPDLADTGPDTGAPTDLLAALFAAPQPPVLPPDDLAQALDGVATSLDGTPSIPAIDQLLGRLAALGPDDAASALPGINALRDRLAASSPSLAATNPSLAEKLAALSAALDAIAPPAVDEQQVADDNQTIALILRSLLGKDNASGEPDAAGPQGDLLRLLASLGLGATAASAPSVDGAVPQPLLRLSNQLSQVATELRAGSPELAGKLEALAARLVSADADPDLFARLTGAAADSDATSLDRLIQSLIEAKPATSAAPTAPQVARPGDLSIPAPIAPKQSKSAVTEVKAAPPETAPVTADSAPRPSAAHATARAPEPRPDPGAAAIVADAVKDDPASPQPPTAQPQPAPATQQARALPAAYQATANPINMGQVAFEMARQVHQGTSRFTIRLDPPELGRVDVRLHVDPAGNVNARLTVDRAETLDLFQRDRQSLERALAQAGLDGARTNLEFSLRQQGHNAFAGMMGGDQRQPGHGGAPHFGSASGDDAAPTSAITLYRGTASAGGVNIFA